MDTEIENGSGLVARLVVDYAGLVTCLMLVKMCYQAAGELVHSTCITCKGETNEMRQIPYIMLSTHGRREGHSTALGTNIKVVKAFILPRTLRVRC